MFGTVRIVLPSIVVQFFFFFFTAPLSRFPGFFFFDITPFFRNPFFAQSSIRCCYILSCEFAFGDPMFRDTFWALACPFLPLFSSLLRPKSLESRHLPLSLRMLCPVALFLFPSLGPFGTWHRLANQVFHPISGFPLRALPPFFSVLRVLFAFSA